MLEIVFSDSAAGCLKQAQHYGVGTYCGGAVGVIVSHSDGSQPTKAELKKAQKELEEQERLAWEEAIPLGGNSKDIVSLALAWSVGSIADSDVGAQRLAVLERLFSIYPQNIGRSAAKEMHQEAAKSLDTLRHRVESGEALRVWYSHQPDEMCGLYWLANLLNLWKQPSAKVVLVKLPDWEEADNTLVRHNGWGGVEPGKWHRYIALQQEAPQAFLQAAALHWANLQEEDTPLRAVVNGTLQSVAETFYDQFILREMAAEGDEFHQAKLIGRVLGKYQLGISDGWIALRMEEMIQAGELEAVTSAPGNAPAYHRTLRKLNEREQK